MTTKYWLIIVVVTGAVGFSSGKFLTPSQIKTVTETKIEYRDKIVQDNNKQTETHKIETKKPDGTDVIVTDTEVKDDTHTTETKDQQTSISQTTVVTSRPDWQVSAGYTPGVPFVQSQQYQGIIQRRLFSEVYAGLSVSSAPAIGIVVSVGF